MVLRTINLVDSVAQINFGVWQSAISTAGELLRSGIETQLWFPADDRFQPPHFVRAVPIIAFDDATQDGLIAAQGLDPATDIIISHGCWKYASKWGARFKKLGYRWIAVPHGMLEPWSRQQKWLKKKIYFGLVERRLLQQADLIRAVSKPEKENLSKLFPDSKIVHIPNGVPISEDNLSKPQSPILFVFMARLHAKKGIVPLVKGWTKSTLCNDQRFSLKIAGPDEGELNEVQVTINGIKNAQYVGSVYGDEKAALLRDSSYYVLPSFSEGFPTSVLEAMERGAIPIISRGCNFNEVFDAGLGYEVLPDENQVAAVLDKIVTEFTMNPEQSNSKRNHEFIAANYSIAAIAAAQLELYQNLPDGKTR